MKKIILLCLLLLPTNSFALEASADTANGYSLQVLEKVLNNWKEPAIENKANTTLALVRITNEGRPYSCEIRKSSGNTLLDNSICDAVAASLSFPPPPYGQALDVSLAFRFGASDGTTHSLSTPAVEKTYAETLVENLKAKVIIPESVKGQVQVSIRLKVSASGNILQLAIEQGSGNIDADNEVLRAIISPGVIVPPPSQKEEEVILTLSMRSN